MNKTSIIPVVTPFVDNKIDKNKILKHGENLLKNNMDFLFLAGSTGLGPSTNTDEKKYLVDIFSHVHDHVILQCGSLNLYDSMDLANYAKKNDIYAIAALPPYYFTDLKKEWLINYYIKISQIYPTIIYNFPATTGYNITYNMVNEIKKNGGNVIGIKETTYNMEDMLETKNNVDDIKVYTGPDEYILSAFRENLDGYVSGAGNYGYEIIKKISENYSNEEGKKYQFLLNNLANMAKKYAPWSATYDMVEIMTGNNVDSPREPILKISHEERKKLEEETLNLLNKYNIKIKI